MKLTELSRSEQAIILSDYDAYREVGRELFSNMEDYLPGELVKSAKKLGLAVGKTLVLQNNNELVILMDYAFHNQRNGAFNALERFVNMNSDVAAAHEPFFETLSKSFYSVFSVMSVAPGIGITVKDRMTQEVFNMVDVGFSYSPRTPALCSRIIPFREGVYCTSGSVLPVMSVSQDKAIERILDKFVSHKKSETQPVFSEKQQAAFQAEIIKCLMRADASEHIGFI